MIKKEEVKHIAGLARIGMAEKEIEKFSHDLSAVLDWIDQLKEVDVSGVEPTAHTCLPVGKVTGMDDVTREDKIDKFLDTEKIIDLFPEKKERYDRVKSVL